MDPETPLSPEPTTPASGTPDIDADHESTAEANDYRNPDDDDDDPEAPAAAAAAAPAAAAALAALADDDDDDIQTPQSGVLGPDDYDPDGPVPDGPIKLKVFGAKSRRRKFLGSTSDPDTSDSNPDTSDSDDDTSDGRRSKRPRTDEDRAKTEMAKANAELENIIDKWNARAAKITGNADLERMVCAVCVNTAEYMKVLGELHARAYPEGQFQDSQEGQAALDEYKVHKAGVGRQMKYNACDEPMCLHYCGNTLIEATVKMTVPPVGEIAEPKIDPSAKILTIGVDGTTGDQYETYDPVRTGTIGWARQQTGTKYLAVRWGPIKTTTRNLITDTITNVREMFHAPPGKVEIVKLDIVCVGYAAGTFTVGPFEKELEVIYNSIAAHHKLDKRGRAGEGYIVSVEDQVNQLDDPVADCVLVGSALTWLE